jgi:Sulfotransferase family
VAASGAVGGPVQPGPVIILGYAHSGLARLQRLLGDSPALACTSGTGVLPLCEQAAAAWRSIDHRDGQLSSLAAASVRALADSMITAILAGAGRTRWCETSTARASSATAFLQLYPAARFLCLHRSCPDVIRAAIRANPWGVAGTAFVPFAAAYPASSAAAVAAYWASCTEALLEFEDAHPGECRRVRYEDLTSHPDRAAAEILGFLALSPGDPAAPWVTGHPDDGGGGRSGRHGSHPPGRGGSRARCGSHRRRGARRARCGLRAGGRGRW